MNFNKIKIKIWLRFASQQGMTGFGTIRNTTYEAEAGELPYEEMKRSETVIPSQAGWNKGDSQKVNFSFNFFF